MVPSWIRFRWATTGYPMSLSRSNELEPFPLQPSLILRRGAAGVICLSLGVGAAPCICYSYIL